MNCIKRSNNKQTKKPNAIKIFILSRENIFNFLLDHTFSAQFSKLLFSFCVPGTMPNAMFIMTKKAWSLP